MRVLIVHNRYRQRGGEDVAVEQERDLLTRAGYTIDALEVTNDSISDRRSPFESASLALNTVWSRSGARLVGEHAAAFDADIVHFHNTFPLISPAAYREARRGGASVVQTTHNYRLICPRATLYRDGRVCEDCVGSRLSLPSIRHACYRESRVLTAPVAAMLAVHRMRGTWSKDVDRFIALSVFQREKLIEGGLPADKIVVSPNGLSDDPGPGADPDGAFLYVGRLTPEKGLHTIMEAWQSDERSLPLRIVGDGPLRDEITRWASTRPHVTVTGPLAGPDVHREMHSARALLFPSVWYEGSPMTVLEALACALPVIASNLGGIPELIDDGQSGHLFPPGDGQALARVVHRVVDQEPSAWERQSAAARRRFEEHYTEEALLKRLTAIFESTQTMRPPAVNP